MLDELAARRRRSSGRNEIVDQQDPVTTPERVGVDLEGRRPVLELVGAALDRVGQLAGLAHRNEADAELPGGEGAEDEAASLHPGHRVDRQAEKGVEELVDGELERRRVADQGSDVAKDDPGLREIRDCADLRLESLHRFNPAGQMLGPLPPRAPGRSSAKPSRLTSPSCSNGTRPSGPSTLTVPRTT